MPHLFVFVEFDLVGDGVGQGAEGLDILIGLVPLFMVGDTQCAQHLVVVVEKRDAEVGVQVQIANRGMIAELRLEGAVADDDGGPALYPDLAKADFDGGAAVGVVGFGQSDAAFVELAIFEHQRHNGHFG